jgi:hypothetical protein
MNNTKPFKINQNTVNKAGRKVKLEISPRSPEECLDIIADIIIERLLEERNKNNKL